MRTDANRGLLVAYGLCWAFVFGALPALADNTATVPSEISRKYGLEVVYRPADLPAGLSTGAIRAKEAPAGDLDSYLKVLSEEWSLYPRALIEKTGLKRLILCSSLSYAGQLRTAIPDFGHNDLYLDVSRGRHNEAYVRKVIHHEYFHVIDWRDDGQLYKDDDWAALNPPGFKYGSGGAAVQNDNTQSLLNENLPGFLDKYAATGVEEDKAEIFSNLVVAPEVVEKRAKSDAVIRAKVERMKELLKRFCAAMDEKFWEAARKSHSRKETSPP